MAGQFCGACHNGKIAFGPRQQPSGIEDPSCERCHSFGKNVPGPDFGGAPNTARLAFSFVSLDEIREGVRRLAALVPVSV